MNPVNMTEILIVNFIGVILMVFLLLTRIENIEKRFAGDILFDTMIWITIAGCLVEILTFVVDGKNISSLQGSVLSAEQLLLYWNRQPWIYVVSLCGFPYI